MGVWGTGLYSGDFAADLRATIGALSRLPFDPDRLVEILCSTEPTAANDPKNEDHTAFWLIAADQFAKRGIASDRVRDMALQIVDAGKDIAMLRYLGMDESNLRKRRQVLEELRTPITRGSVTKPRSVLKKPQPLLLAVGDTIVYPTRHGSPINPYYATIRIVDGRPWIPDGWGAAVIIDCGRAFDFLSWYRQLTLAEARREKPSLDSLHGDVLWRHELPGTCSPTHFKRMELEGIGKRPVDLEKVRKLFPKPSSWDPERSAAVSSISLANRPHAAPCGGEPTELYRRQDLVMGIEQMLRQGEIGT